MTQRLADFPDAANLINVAELRMTQQSYVESVIFRDVIERHNVSNIALLKYFTFSLLKNIANLYSVNKFCNDIKSQSYKVGKDTLHNYLGYLEDAFLIFSVPLYTESERTKQTVPKKYMQLIMDWFGKIS